MAMRKSILDYILMEEEERMRLGIPQGFYLEYVRPEIARIKTSY